MGILGINRDITELKNAEELAQQRARQLQIAAEVARDTSGLLNTDQLLTNAVNLIRERFGFYHASIFLLDALEEYAVLRESTGEVGAQMKQRGHRLAVGSQSIVGQATARKEAFVVNDVSREPLHYANPLLPETRSELAIPLIVGEKVLGAIDVQSTLVNAFIPDEVNTLQILADQLAIAAWNSVLFGQTQENLAQHRLLHQITIAASAANSIDEALGVTVKALHTATGGERVMILLLEHDHLYVRTAAGYEGIDFSNYSIRLGDGIPGLAAQLHQPVRINDLANHPGYTNLDSAIQSELAVPIYFSDRTIGVLDIASFEAGAYDETDQEILASLGNTLGAVIANAQLVQQVRQQVNRQKMLFEVTSRIRRTTDIQTILQTSAKEIARTLGAKRARIEISVAQPPQSQQVVKNNGNNNGNNNGGNGHKNGKEAAT
jgi:GAF domain-containing protein